MSPFAQTLILFLAILLVLAAVAALLLLPRRRERLRRLRAMATLLRSSDVNVRVDTLEKVRGLVPRDRGLLARVLRRQLSAASGGKTPGQQAVLVWFIRQVLALLADARTAVRADAARALSAVMGRGGAKLFEDREGTDSVSPAVMSVVELAGGRVFLASEEARGQTRVLAFAELLEAGLRPLALGMSGLEEMKEEALEPIESALRDRSPRVRRTVCEVLAAMGGERGIELLMPLLQDPSPELRARAAQSLGGLKATSAATEIAQLLKDPVPAVRAAAAGALAEIGARRECAATIDSLVEECRREDGAEEARSAMIDAVAGLIDGAARELRAAFNSLPRGAAVRLAAALEGRGVVERWLLETRAEGEAETVSGLLATMARLGSARPLLEALDHADGEVRHRAAQALGESQDPAALTALAGLLGDPEARVRSQAVASVASAGRQRALHPLAQAAADPDHDVRMAAVEGLRAVLAHRREWEREPGREEMDLEAALGEAQRSLLLALEDPSEGVRETVAEALASLGSGAAGEALVTLALSDSSEDVRSTAAGVLARLGLPQTRRMLAAALEDDDEVRRRRAMIVLGEIGTPEAAQYLVEALRDRSPEVRETAVRVLARVEIGRVVDRLISELRNPDPKVRAGVAMQLGRARATKAVGALAQALGDPAERVRVNAVRALGSLGRAVRKHEGALAARMNDPSPEVREAATVALESLREAWRNAPEVAEVFGGGALSMTGAAALVEMAGEGDVDPLMWALGDREAAQSVVAFLEEAGEEKLGALLAALRKADEPDRVRVVSALAQAVGRVGSAEHYLAQLRAIDSEVRLMAVEIAAALATPEATEALVEALQHDPLSEVRSRAASALAEAPGEKVRSSLARAEQEDPNEVVRLVAARVLSQRGESGKPTPIPFPDRGTAGGDAAR